MWRAIDTGLRRTFQFSGRSSRAEFWWFSLFAALIVFAGSLVDRLVLSGHGANFAVRSFAGGMEVVLRASLGPVEAVLALVLAIPALSVAWRRMQDAGFAGWLSLVPLLGCALAAGLMIGAATMVPDTNSTAPLWSALLILLVSFVLPILWASAASQPGSNRYGPNPFEVIP